MLKTLEQIFKYFVARRNKKYDCGKAEIIAIDRPVVSIGALSAGGAGKTPFAIYLSNLLSANGMRPLVICRGYKREIKGMTIVSDGTSLLSDIAHSGDEPTLIAKNTKAIVIANESKSDAALYAEKNLEFDVAIIDDGFQHRRLKRDFDIVIIDKETLDKPYMFPRGLLREGLSALSRAKCIAFMNGAEPNAEVLKNIRKDAVIIKCKSEKSELQNANSGSTHDYSGEPVLVLTAIAKPDRFFSSLAELNINIAQKKVYSDHYKFTVRDITAIIEICKNAQVNYIICTEKDAVKLLEFKSYFGEMNINLIYLPIKLVVQENEPAFINEVLKIAPRK